MEKNMKKNSVSQRIDPLKKAFNPLGNKVIKLAGTNYFDNILKNKNMRFIGKSVLFSNYKDDTFNSRNKFNISGEIRSFNSNLNQPPKDCFKKEDNYFIKNKRSGNSKPNEPYSFKTSANITQSGKGNIRNAQTGFFIEESSFHSTIFHTEVPVIKKKIKLSTTRLQTKINEKIKVFLISRQNLHKMEKAPPKSQTGSRSKTKLNDLAKVFENKNSLMQKNKLNVSKFKELKIELMIDERKNRKNLDELAKIRIQSNEYLKYFHSKLNKEKKQKND